jgi:hypothetical protein
MDTAILFQRFLLSIKVPASGLLKAKNHAATIKTRLNKSFKLRKFIIVGSHSRGSAIRSYSDLDCFAVVSRDDARWGGTYTSSYAVLDRLRCELASRFPQTPVSRDQQAVVVRFAAGDYPVDVVPAFFWATGPDNWPVYQIPNGEGEWMETGPGIHGKFIRDAGERSRGKLHRTVQLLKFWRECRTPRVPLSSFHLELLLADHHICEGAKSYSQCLTEAFQLLAQRECRAYRDPMKVSGNVGAVKSESQREAAMRSVIYSRDHAKAGFAAELHGDHGESQRHWNIVFCGRFPR